MDVQKDFPVSVRDIRISDPCVLPVPELERYFICARQFDPNRFPEVERGPYFYAMESPDLIHWSRPYRIFEKPDDFWADLDYWAPEMHAYKGKYYIFSSFRAAGKYRRCQALVSDSPRGPFRPVRNEPVTPEGWHCLDGTLYIDKKEHPWMVFCHEWLQVCDGQVCAIPLSEDLGKAIGDPIILFRATDAPWRKDAPGIVTDGPWLYRTKIGTLLMQWSSFSSDGGYTVGCARSLSGEIQGPWIQDPDPVYAMDGAHSMLFHTFDGQLIMSLHCPNNPAEKRMLLFEMEERNDRLYTVNEITGNWYNAIGGKGERYRYKETITENPAFSHLSKPYGGR